jgi:Sensors of blue-light using FAD
MTETDPRESPTFRLVYRSHSRIPVDGRVVELGEIFSVARPANKKLGITGALLLTDGWFVQVLEGQEAAVRGLYERIAADPRHDAVELLQAVTVDERVFARWAMAKVAQDGEADIPLIAGARGATAAAGHEVTTQQQVVLDMMRLTARAADAAGAGVAADAASAG